jgi:hypothetical protein
MAWLDTSSVQKSSTCATTMPFSVAASRSTLSTPIP